MQEYKKELERELDENLVGALVDYLREFFGRKFEIIKSEKGADLKKGLFAKSLVARVDIPDEEIYVVDEKYRRKIEGFRDFYENESGVNLFME